MLVVSLEGRRGTNDADSFGVSHSLTQTGGSSEKKVSWASIGESEGFFQIREGNPPGKGKSAAVHVKKVRDTSFIARGSSIKEKGYIPSLRNRGRWEERKG